MAKLPPNKKNASTETSYTDLEYMSISSLSEVVEAAVPAVSSPSSVMAITREPSVLIRNFATSTELFPIHVNMVDASTMTDLKGLDIAVEPAEKKILIKEEPTVVITESIVPLIDSKEHLVKFSVDGRKSGVEPETVESEELIEPPTSSLHMAQQIKLFHYDDSDEEYETNLKMGNVFVYMVIPPDGGYGWFIVLMSFLCQVVVDGIIFSIGILLPPIATEFDVSASAVVLVASMQVAFYYLFGTVSSALINKYGFRPIGVIGSALSVLFLSVASCSVNYTMLIAFYSILGGPALSMVWVSSQLIIGYYFDRYRPIANGVSCSGAGIGVMVFCYMNSVLVPDYGWRNVMRIHVCLMAAALLMALTFIQVPPTRIGRMKEVWEEETDSESGDYLTELTRYSRFSLKVNNEEYALDQSFEDMLERPIKVVENKPSLCTRCEQKCCCCLVPCLERRRRRMAIESAARGYVIQPELIEMPDLFYTGPRDNEIEEVIEETLRRRTTVSLPDDASWHTISLENIENEQTRRTILNVLSTRRTTKMERTFSYRRTYMDLKQTEKWPLLAYLSPKNWLHPKIQKALALLFDFHILQIKEFRILLLSAFFFPMGFNIPFVYSTIRAEIDPSNRRLITPTIGLSNFVFRVLSGFIAYKYRDHTIYICGAGLFVGGVAVFISAFYGLDVVWFQFTYATIYGIAPAFYSTLRAISYVQVLGLDKLTSAFGLTALAMGLGVFIGTTAGGILNELTGNYQASFIFAGVCICISGALKLMLPYFVKHEHEKDKKPSK